jgi:gliding motility-associated-like protein
MKKLLLFSTLLFWFGLAKAQTNFITQDSIFARSTTCDGGIEACIDSIAYDNVNNLRFYLNGRQFTANATQCSTKTVHNYSYTDIFRAGERGPWQLQSWTVRGRTYSMTFSNLQTLLDSMRRWDPLGNWQLDNTTQIIFGFPATRPDSGSYGLQRILGTQRGGLSEVLYNQGVEFSGLRFKVPAGLHEFVVEKVNLNQRDTVTILAACLQTDVVRRTVNVGSTMSYCADAGQLLGPITSIRNLCAGQRTHVSFATPNSGCIQFTGITEGVDTACLQVCDRFGFCDTTTLVVSVNPATNRTTTIRDTITIGLPVRVAQGILRPSGTITSFENFCPTSSGTSVNFFVFNENVTYQATRTAGVDTACIRVCVGTVCDTTILIVEAKNPTLEPTGRRFTFTDTITVGNSRTKVSFDAPTGRITSFQNNCTQNSGSNVRFTLNTNAQTVTYEGLSVGADTACIVFCNAANVCDTTIMIITGVQNTGGGGRGRRIVIEDTLTSGLIRNYCASNGRLLIPSGTLGGIFNLCPNFGTNIFDSVSINPTTRCVTVIGDGRGVDSLCIVACNTEGVCDTTILKIRVINGTISPLNLVFGKEVGTSHQYCQMNLPLGRPKSMQVTFDNRLGSISYTLDTVNFCFNYTVLRLSVDTAHFVCVNVCDSTNTCASTCFNIFGTRKAVTRTIRDTINVSENKEYCRLRPFLTTTNATNTWSYNLCPLDSGQISVRFDSLFNDGTGGYAFGQGCMKVRGNAPGRGRVCLYVCQIDSLVQAPCDTTYFDIVVRNTTLTGRSTTLRDTITLGNSREKCDLLVPTGTVASMTNVCSTNANGNVAFTFAQSRSNCLTYRGLEVGADTICLRTCNAQNVCDTTTYIVTTVVSGVNRRIHAFSDTISRGLTRAICTLPAPPTATTIRNICETQSGQNVDFRIDRGTLCVDYFGVSVGKDTACIEICNAAGLCDTTYMEIETINPQILRGGIRTDSIRVVAQGAAGTYCADSTRVGATFQVGIQAPSGQNFSVSSVIPRSATQSSACLSVRGFIPGRDTILHILVGSNGIQDTTRLIVIVVPRDTIIRPTPSIDSIRISILEQKTYCPDTTELRGSPIVSIAACSIDPFDNTTIRFDQATKCVSLRGVSAGVDTFCLVVCNQAGFCDTTRLFVRVTPDTVRPTLRIDTVRVLIGDSLTYCQIDTSQIGGRVDTIYNICPQFSGTNARVNLTAAKCLNIIGLSTGVDTACIVVCNNTTRLCDTTRVITIVSPKNTDPRPSVDSIRVEVTQFKNYCPDTTELSGSPVTSIAFCSNTPFDNATITLDNLSKCARITGTVVGRDTVCLVVCNAARKCDTTTLYVNIIPLDTTPIRADTVTVTVRIGQDSLFCGVDTSRIRGAVDTIYQICPGLNGLRALMVIQPNRCVRITGRQMGRDTMCVVVCNRASNRCDTTVIVANVIDSTLGPIILNAIDDLDSIQVRGGRQIGRFKDLLVYANDTFNRPRPTSLVIITPPRKGIADTISFGFGLIRYTVGRGTLACGLDSFTYRVCIDTVCDTAVVRILVDCVDTLVVYNAVSPNGDGRNDVMVIQGLHVYPNHTVCVYNRWGNEVFRTKDYQNDWGGTWNGKDLPDGTYFVLITNDDDKSVLKKGYVQIMR